MKRMNKFLAAILALAIILSVSAVAFAAVPFGTQQTGSLRIVKYSNEATEAISSSYVGTQNETIESGCNQYAINGVVFTYLKVADVNYNSTTGEIYYTNVDTGSTSPFNGVQFDNAERQSFTAEQLIVALNNKGQSVAEAYVEANGGTQMPATKQVTENGVTRDGVTSVTNLPVGLYLVVETDAPDLIKSPCAPFLMSLPLFTNEGCEYDLTVYPKNSLDEENPDLDKGVSNEENGTYGGTTTASIGDTVYYQITSKLPTISYTANYVAQYTFTDRIVNGLAYNKDVKIYFGNDEWADTNYSVAYTDTTMTITPTTAGFADINANRSGATMVIKYTCKLTEDAVIGDAGNPNTVTLDWKRESTTTEQLKDDAHVYTYGIKLTKQFKDKTGDFSEVKFTVKLDDTAIKANVSNGVYTVDPSGSQTEFSPNAEGILILKGLKPGTYKVKEVATDDEFKLLADEITVVITATKNEEAAVCTVCGEKPLVGAATVNGGTAMMVDGLAELTVVNNPSFKLPQTGSTGTWLISVCGILAMAAAAFVIILVCRKKKTNDAE